LKLNGLPQPFLNNQMPSTFAKESLKNEGRIPFSWDTFLTLEKHHFLTWPPFSGGEKNCFFRWTCFSLVVRKNGFPFGKELSLFHSSLFFSDECCGTQIFFFKDQSPSSCLHFWFIFSLSFSFLSFSFLSFSFLSSIFSSLFSPLLSSPLSPLSSLFSYML
jgi:hypothetical protein